EKKGPAVSAAFDSSGQPLPAAEGFFRSVQLEPVSLQAIKDGKVKELSLRSIKETDYLFAEINVPGVSTAKLLQDNLSRLILGLDFPKKMRWGDQEMAFARPIRLLAALFGSSILPFAIGNINSGRTSFGHRQ